MKKHLSKVDTIGQLFNREPRSLIQERFLDLSSWRQREFLGVEGGTVCCL